VAILAPPRPSGAACLESNAESNELKKRLSRRRK